MIIKACFTALTLAIGACLASYANAAGTINFSLSQQFDEQGRPLRNCKLYIYQAGTVATPQSPYSDTNLTIPVSNPIRCDASGRLQQFFLADGSIKVRLTDENGVDVLTADNLLVIGPSAGGGGGGSVDATTIYQTGDIKVRWGTGTHTGWVRAAGRTIGSATSGATERANADTQTLWEYLCTNDTTLRATISGGYSGSCANDYAANKTIQVPDYRGSAIVGLGDMGNSATSVLTTTYCGADPTVLGQYCGAQSKTLSQANLPNVTLTFSSSSQFFNSSTTYPVNLGATASVTLTPSAGTVSGNTSSINGNVTQSAFSIIPPSRLSTIYIKL